MVWPAPLSKKVSGEVHLQRPVEYRIPKPDRDDMEPVIRTRIAALGTCREYGITARDLIAPERILHGLWTMGGIEQIRVGIGRAHIVDIVGE